MNRFHDYLGDGVYAEWDGCYIILSTETEGQKHVIYFEPEVLSNLDMYRKRLKFSLMEERRQ